MLAECGGARQVPTGTGTGTAGAGACPSRAHQVVPRHRAKPTFSPSPLDGGRNRCSLSIYGRCSSRCRPPDPPPRSCEAYTISTPCPRMAICKRSWCNGQCAHVKTSTTGRSAGGKSSNAGAWPSRAPTPPRPAHPAQAHHPPAVTLMCAIHVMLQEGCGGQEEAASTAVPESDEHALVPVHVQMSR